MENDPDKIHLRLKWRQTWEDRENDFVASAEEYEGPVGRINLHDSGGFNKGLWSWTFQARSPDIRLSPEAGATSGFQPTAREAAREVERTWFAAIKGGRYDTQDASSATPTNAYAAAKGR